MTFAELCTARRLCRTTADCVVVFVNKCSAVVFLSHRVHNGIRFADETQLWHRITRRLDFEGEIDWTISFF